MWKQEVRNTTEKKIIGFNKYSIIAIPILLSTSFLDDFISYFTRTPFFPGFCAGFMSLIVDSIIMIVTIVIIVLVIRLQNAKFNTIFGSIGSLACYIYSLESNMTNMSLDKAIISY